MHAWRLSGFAAILFVLSACSSPRPILYPNSHWHSVGKEVAAQDIDACKQLAESAGAGIGAAAGAVGGAISGAAGHGSAIGAASGAVWGLFAGLFHAAFGPSHPPEAYTNFVNRCLREKGYEVGGWQ